jgi:hypothetical protein
MVHGHEDRVTSYRLVAEAAGLAAPGTDGAGPADAAGAATGAGTREPAGT